MTYTWYKLVGYKPYWTNSTTSLPENHIESIVENTGATWEKVTNTVNWSAPSTEAILNINDLNLIPYIKCNDGINNFYFYYDSVLSTAGSNAKGIHFKAIFILDTYMTIHHKKLELLKSKNVEVKHLRAFTDRVLHTTDNNQNLITVTLNLIEQKQFGNTTSIENPQLVRNYLYGTNELDIWNNNFKASVIRPEPEAMIDIPQWADETQKKSIAFSEFTTTNKNNRYCYLVCKSSAKQKGKSTTDIHPQTYAKNTKLIIPMFNSKYNDIIDGCMNIDAQDEQTNMVNALNNSNFIGYYECDIPYSVFYAISKQENSPITLRHGNNKTYGSNKEIIFFEIPTNYSPKLKLVDYKNYTGMESKIKYLIHNLDRVNPKTEPTLLNPLYYTEKCAIDSNKFISTDLSLINYTLTDLTGEGLSLNFYPCFDSGVSIAYDYGDFNNKSNTLWNNKYSNVRNEISTDVGIYGSAVANYVANNPNTLVTGASSRVRDNVFSGIKQVAGAFSDVVGMVANPYSIPSRLSNIASGINSTVQKNMDYASNIHNIESSPNTLLTNPFVDASIPNQIINGNSLFNTYAYELHPWDKDVILSYILSSGYPINKIANINDYKNRKYMNVLNLDISYNMDDLINTLLKNDRGLFSGVSYNYQFLTWLGALHRLYSTNDIVNVTSYKESDYVDNVEINKIPIPTEKIDINTLITDREIKVAIFFPDFQEKALELLKAQNPDAPADIWENIELINVNLYSYVLNTRSTSTKYYSSSINKCFANYKHHLCVCYQTFTQQINIYDDTVGIINALKVHFIGRIPYIYNNSVKVSEVLKIKIISIDMNLPDGFLSDVDILTHEISHLYWNMLETVDIDLHVGNIGSNFMVNALDKPPHSLTTIKANKIGEWFYWNGLCNTETLSITCNSISGDYLLFINDYPHIGDIDANVSLNVVPTLSAESKEAFTRVKVKELYYNITLTGTATDEIMKAYPNGTQGVLIRNLIKG